MDKDSFSLSEKATVLLQLENLACRAAISCITLQVVQSVKIMSVPGVSTFRYKVLSEAKYAGIGANSASTTPRELEIDFYSIIEPYLK